MSDCFLLLPRNMVSIPAEPRYGTRKGKVYVQVDDDATQREIKMAYRSLAKECHPDYLGNEGHNICILLNEVCFDSH